jgi:hypothetical protein
MPFQAHRPSKLPLCLALALALLAGCSALYRIQLDPVAKSVEPPSNVAVYLAASHRDQPLTDLGAQSFRIYEDGRLLSPEESRQTLLARDAVALHKALLLVDLSTAEDPALRHQVARAAAAFVARVRAHQDVTVMAFDGRPEPILIGDFPKGGAGPEEIAELTQFSIADRSRNLHGAIIKAGQTLDARLMTEKKPIRIGSLVVMTTGEDLAGRWSYEGLRGVLDKSPHRVFAIGIGDRQRSFSLEDLGRAGSVRAPSLTSAELAFEQMAAKVEAAHAGFYLLSYCSPARDGQRMIKIEVTHHDAEGNQVTGSLYEQLDAAGFGPGCDPTTMPRFGAAITPPPSPAPEPEPPPPLPAPSDAGELPGDQ